MNTIDFAKLKPQIGQRALHTRSNAIIEIIEIIEYKITYRILRGSDPGKGYIFIENTVQLSSQMDSRNSWMGGQGPWILLLGQDKPV